MIGRSSAIRAAASSGTGSEDSATEDPGPVDAPGRWTGMRRCRPGAHRGAHRGAPEEPMAKLQRRDLGDPTEVIDLPLGPVQSFSLGELVVARSVFQPGWRWSVSVKPLAGTEWCEFHHVGYTLAGRARVVTRDGAGIGR